MNAQIEMKGGSPWRPGSQICRPVRTGSHLIQLRQMRNFFEVGYSSGVDHSRSNVIDELFLNQLLAIEN